MPIPRSRYMADDPRTDLHETTREIAGSGAPLPTPPKTVNELAELVADVLEPSGLVARDRLAALRGPAHRGARVRPRRRPRACRPVPPSLRRHRQRGRCAECRREDATRRAPAGRGPAVPA